MKASLPILLALLLIFSPETYKWIINSFKPVIYGLITAYLLDSSVMLFMKKLKVKRSQGILLTCLLVIGIIGLLIYKILPQIVENISNIMSFIMEGNHDISRIVTDIRNKIDNKYIQYLTAYILQAGESIRKLTNIIFGELYNLLMSIISNLGSKTWTLATSFIINIYMLAEKEDILARGRRLIHAYSGDEKAGRILSTFSLANKIFKSFLNGKLLDSAIVGIMCSLVFAIARVPYAPLMGSIIGVFNLIPYFGPIIGSLPVVAVSFLIDPPKALSSLIIIIVIQQLDGNIIEPKIVGANVGVSPFWIISSVTVGGNLFGITGMIFAVPLVVLVKTMIEESVDMRLLEKGKENLEKTKLRK